MDKPQTEHSAQTMDSGRVPFFRGIQFKYAVTYLLLIALVLLLLNTYPLLMAQNMVFRSKESSLKSQASGHRHRLGCIRVLTAEGTWSRPCPFWKSLSATRILVTDGAGLILYDTSEIDNRLYSHALLGEVVAALRGEDVFRSEYRDGAFRCRARQCLWSTGGSPWGQYTSTNMTPARRSCCNPSSPICGTSPS